MVGESTADSPAAFDLPQPLLAGLMLLLTTGFIDIYTFLAHGHVFAEAMTGNLVLIGVGTSIRRPSSSGVRLPRSPPSSSASPRRGG